MNRHLQPRSVVDPNFPLKYAGWVRNLRGQNGTYAIFNASTRGCEYVGVSSAQSLYGTLTRHFQRWERRKGNEYTGPTFERGAVLVAVEVIQDPTIALLREQEWIASFSPRLNRQFSLIDDIDEREPEGDELDAAADEIGRFFDELTE